MQKNSIPALVFAVLVPLFFSAIQTVFAGWPDLSDPKVREYARDRWGAEQGYSSAQYNLGLRYHDRSNYAEAVRWYRKAADQGLSDAQLNLGYLYALGRGVAKNYEEAARWYRRAAEQGNSIAQLNLGNMYADGRGVPGNNAEAVRWYRRAAEQGVSAAQYNLGWKYAHGQGVPRNYVFAYKWTSLAAAQGDEIAQDNLEILERQMTGDQMGEAQRLAAAFHASAEVGSFGGAPQPRPQRKRPPPDTSPTVRQIQSHLSVLGYEPGPVDGLMGPRTAGAIRSFQEDAGIEPDGLASTTLEALLAALVEDREKTPATDSDADGLQLASTGTGFFVTDDGHLLTNHHVVEGCALIRVVLPSGSVDGSAVAESATDDLAVIFAADAEPEAVASFRGTSAALGEDLIAIGYPLQNLLGGAVNATFGSVSSNSGPGGDRRFIQMTAPVQPGNSGGPLLDETGAVIGVVVAKLDAVSVAIATGDIPQNVNFGIKGAVARSFLSIHDIDYEVADSQSRSAGRPAVVSTATAFTVPVECWK